MGIHCNHKNPLIDTTKSTVSQKKLTVVPKTNKFFVLNCSAQK